MSDRKNPDEIKSFIESIPDDVLQAMKFQMVSPWQNTTGNRYVDADGAPISAASDKTDSPLARDELQQICWNKFNQSPQLNTSVRGTVGRLTGLGFCTSSYNWEIQEAIEEIEEDPRNRLYNFWPKYTGRSIIEGELHLLVTLHPEGFTEIDFVDPVSINHGGDDDTGIIFHPSKTVMPLFYNIGESGDYIQVPSIFIARYPELVNVVKNHKDYDRTKQQRSRDRKVKYRSLGGYNRFVISWDKGFVTRRATSYLRTTLEWLNHYENLKKYEIDHKKSSGAYLWVFSIENARDFKSWIALSDEDRAKTGIASPKEPGGSLILPPGMKVQCHNPNLTRISDQDTDIMSMVTSGLNEANDVTTGDSKGSFASVKESRGPMSDRTSDEVAYFQRFLIHDFWSSIFFLRSSVSSFPKFFNEEIVVGFNNDEDRTNITKVVKRKPEKLITVSFPVSETVDLESRTKALLGVKHGPISETMGIPNEKVASTIGFSGYRKARLDKATEELHTPKLVYTVDAETLQEKVEGEKGKKGTDKNKGDEE